jgi:hypothetical protein
MSNEKSRFANDDEGSRGYADERASPSDERASPVIAFWISEYDAEGNWIKVTHGDENGRRLIRGPVAVFDENGQVILTPDDKFEDDGWRMPTCRITCSDGDGFRDAKHPPVNARKPGSALGDAFRDASPPPPEAGGG